MRRLVALGLSSVALVRCEATERLGWSSDVGDSGQTCRFHQQLVADSLEQSAAVASDTLATELRSLLSGIECVGVDGHTLCLSEGSASHHAQLIATSNPSLDAILGIGPRWINAPRSRVRLAATLHYSGESRHSACSRDADGRYVPWVLRAHLYCGTVHGEAVAPPTQALPPLTPPTLPPTLPPTPSYTPPYTLPNPPAPLP